MSVFIHIGLDKAFATSVAFILSSALNPKRGSNAVDPLSVDLVFDCGLPILARLVFFGKKTMS